MRGTRFLFLFCLAVFFSLLHGGACPVFASQREPGQAVDERPREDARGANLASEASREATLPATSGGDNSPPVPSGGTHMPDGRVNPDFQSALPLVMESEDERLVRWDMNADSMMTLHDAEILEASGNVFIRRGNEYLKADFARYYMGTKWVYLKGNVVVRNGQDELVADEAEFDLRSRVGWLTKGRIFVGGPHAYIAGERIDKHWGDVYTFKQAKITTCDGDSPAWSFSAEEAVVEIDGYARLTRAAFQIKDAPVAFAPYFVVPVKTTRQTGFLRPEYGRSDVRGAYYNQPFFWAVNESSDLMVNEYFMEKRGFMHGAEYRAAPVPDANIWLRGDWMYDKKRNMDDTGKYSGDGLVRTNQERYWLRGMVDARLPDPNWRFKMDLDYVSDQYFLSEFNDGISSFSRSREELYSIFSRDLQEKSLNRQSGFLLSRDWDRFTLALSSTYTQDPSLGHGNRSRSLDETVQRLPQLDAFLHKGRILPQVPLEFDFAAQGAYMYRKSGTRGARYEIIPRLTLPINTRYGSIIASTSLVQTLYDTENASNSSLINSWSDGSDETGAKRQHGDSRTIPEFSVAGFTELAKVYGLASDPLMLDKEHVGDSRTLAIRHSLQPRVEFRHRVKEAQDDNPTYSSEDRLSPHTELVYSLTNVFTTKEEKVVMTKNEAGELVPQLVTAYRELVRLRLEQAYDHREANRSYDRDTYPKRRPFSDILGELRYSPTERIALSTKNYWSPYRNELTNHQSGATVSFPGYGDIYVGYDFRKAIDDEYNRKHHTRDISYLRMDLETAKFANFSLKTSLRVDYKNPDNRETDVDLIYNHQCFKVIGRVSVDPQEENYQLYFMLTGLGD